MNIRSTKSSTIKNGFVLLVTIISLYSVDSLAQWSTNPYLNNPVCIDGSPQGRASIAADGTGGSIFAWVDARVPGEDIYAQRIDANGVVRWTTDGIAICSATSQQGQVAIISDGNGGAIIAWTDIRNGTDYNIYAQRVDGSGAVQWPANGVAISNAPGDQTYPILASDGNGGAIFTWTDNRNPTVVEYNIYAQGINANGTLKWSEIPVCTIPLGQIQPAIIGDGSGGAIIAWMDSRNQPNGTSVGDIYAQRIGANGVAQWTNDGLSVCEAFRNQGNPQLVSDGSGGAIISWQDERNLNDTYPSNSDIFAQRITSDGIAQWTTNGIGISTTTERQTGASITSDQAGGAIIVWENWSGFVNNIYVQRVNGNGNILWAMNGIPIGSGGKFLPNLVSDGNGGAFITWEDSRSGAIDIYAQHIDAGGLEVWRPFGGIVVSNSYGSQSNPHLVNDNSGGIIIAWDDYRNINIDIFAQHVQSDGTLGGGIPTGNEPLSFNQVVSVFPNPVVNDLTIDLSSISSDSPVSVSLFDLYGRTLKTIKGNGVMQLSFNTYKPSTYILQIRYGGQILTKLITKK